MTRTAHICSAGHCVRLTGPQLLVRVFDAAVEHLWWPSHFGCTEFQRNHR